jgi:hypothetical protein
VKSKKWLLLLIIAFPSVFWLLLETSTINTKRLPVYGPRHPAAGNERDTVFHRVPDEFMEAGGEKMKLDAESFPVFVAAFVDENYVADGYRIAGLWEYINYKQSKIAPIPIILITRQTAGEGGARRHLERLKESPNVRFSTWPDKSYDSLRNIFFAEKPYYVDLSFFALVDSERRIRGYYDGRYVAEIKRLIDEHQHLRLKEEKRKLTESHEIEIQK